MHKIEQPAAEAVEPIREAWQVPTLRIRHVSRSEGGASGPVGDFAELLS
jgi:hypothetical protein